MKKLCLVVLLLTTNEVLAFDSVESMVKECWLQHNHAEMSACVAHRASNMRSKLTSTEGTIRTALTSTSQTPGQDDYKKDAKQHFESSVATYAAYRQQQCAFRQAMASQGNGAQDIQLACEASLDADRTEQLKAAMTWLD